MIVKIYVLIDPKTCKVRYIGRTRKASIKDRLAEHISKAKYHKKYGRKATHKINWINNLLLHNCKPVIKVLTTIEGWKESYKLEQFLINKYKEIKDLVNSHDRGDGGKLRTITDAEKLKISNTLKRKYASGEISPTRTKKVYTYNLKGKFLNEYVSLAECSRQLNFNYSSLSAVLSGKYLQCHGIRFSFEKLDSLPSIEKPHKGIRNHVLLKNDTETLEFSSMLKCKNFLNLTYTGTSIIHFNRTIFKEFGDKYLIIINGIEYPYIRLKRYKGWVTINNEEIYFSSLKEIGKLLNICRSKCYKKYIDNYIIKHKVNIRFAHNKSCELTGKP